MRIFNVIKHLIKVAVYKNKFLAFGWHSSIDSPLKIGGAKNIVIGDGVTVNYKTWLAAISISSEGCRLIIEDGCTIGNFNHIYSTKKVILHKNVLTADKVYISDNLHGFEDINTPILKQPVKQNGEVEIGEGSWLGENVCVLGVKIGKHCVVGANSVVTHDIPDYCVAVGAPAFVIKRYDFKTKTWRKTDNNGLFIEKSYEQ